MLQNSQSNRSQSGAPAKYWENGKEPKDAAMKRLALLRNLTSSKQ